MYLEVLKHYRGQSAQTAKYNYCSKRLVFQLQEGTAWYGHIDLVPIQLYIYDPCVDTVLQLHNYWLEFHSGLPVWRERKEKRVVRCHLFFNIQFHESKWNDKMFWKKWSRYDMYVLNSAKWGLHIYRKEGKLLIYVLL